jgi:hypothetical protein
VVISIKLINKRGVKELSEKQTEPSQIKSWRFSTMSNELFADISEEQQSIVAGGGGFDPATLLDIVKTDYLATKDTTAFKFGIASGPGGSVVEQQFVTDSVKIDTSAAKLFAFNK